MKLPVKDNGERPAGQQGTCFYCRQPIGTHAADCVCVEKSVVLRATIEYIVAVPDFWDQDSIEFQRNDGSFCMDNDFERIAMWADRQPNPGPCTCGATHITFVRDATAEDHENMIDLCHP